MDDKIFDQIQQVDLKKTMETSYIDYAMSVIASRALPDVRDGLKPVQRRVLAFDDRTEEYTGQNQSHPLPQLLISVVFVSVVFVYVTALSLKL